LLANEKFVSLLSWYHIAVDTEKNFSPAELGLAKKKKHQEAEQNWDALERMFDPENKEFVDNVEELVKTYFKKPESKQKVPSKRRAMFVTNEQIDMIFKMVTPEQRAELQKYVTNMKGFNNQHLNLISSNFFKVLKEQDSKKPGKTNLLSTIARYLDLDSCQVELDKDTLGQVLSGQNTMNVRSLRDLSSRTLDQSDISKKTSKIVNNISSYFGLKSKDTSLSPSSSKHLFLDKSNKSIKIFDDGDVIEISNQLSQLKLKDLVPNDMSLEEFLDGRGDVLNSLSPLSSKLITLKEKDFEKLCQLVNRDDILQRKTKGNLSKGDLADLDKAVGALLEENGHSKTASLAQLPVVINLLEEQIVKKNWEKVKKTSKCLPVFDSIDEKLANFGSLSDEERRNLANDIKLLMEIMIPVKELSPQQIANKIKQMTLLELKEELADVCTEAMLSQSPKKNKFNGTLTTLKGDEKLAFMVNNFKMEKLGTVSKSALEKAATGRTQTMSLTALEWKDALKSEDEKQRFAAHVLSTGQLADLAIPLKDMTADDLIKFLAANAADRELVAPAGDRTEDLKKKKQKKQDDDERTNQKVYVKAKDYANLLVLGADKMDAGVLKKENDKLKEWLKQQGVEVNLSDLKPGDEAGKAKRIAAIIKENPFLGELQVTKKEAETVCKATKTALENIVVLNDAPQYLPHQEVPLDLNSVVDKLIISSDKIDKKTLAKHSEKIKEYLEKTGIEVDLSGVKAGDEEGKLKKLRDIIQQNAAALQTAGDDFALTKKEVDEISKAAKTPFTDLVKPATEDAKAVKRAKLKDLKPTDNVRVDALKYAETLVLGADKMDAGVLKKENDKLKEWLKQQGVEVNLSDLKPGDEAGKAKRIAAIIKENPFLGELQVTKKEAETVCKATKTALENIVVLNDAPQYLPHQEVPLDLNSVVDKLIISSDKIDKKTLAKHSEKIKEYLEKTGIEVDLSGVKAGDEEGKLKKLRDIIQQNAAALQTAGDDFALTKKEVDEISKATKTPFTDLVKPATEDAKAVKRAKLKDLKPTDNVRVDALKYAETLVLGADKMDAGVLKKENDKLKEWLKQQGVEVNLSDLKPGDEAGKAKRIAAIIKENPFLGELQVTKKEAETVCKATKTALENIVVLNDAPQYLPHQEVPLDLNSVVDKLIISSDKIDKKTLAKHSEKIKEYLEKTGIEVDLSGVKAGDEEGKLKKLRDIIQQNAAALQTAGDDFALTKKEVDEISKATKTPFTDLVKPATEDAKAVKRAKLKDLKPTDNVRVDALKYAETLVLGADKMDAGVLKKENDKLKEWLKQQGVEVNLSDLKPGDEAGKAKRIAAIIKENPFLGELQVTKKEAETVCKATKTALENIVVLNDAPQYLPHQEVPLDLNSVVDKLIISSDKIDKKTLAKHSEKIKEYLEKTGIEVDLSGVKAGDEEGKLKKLRDIIQQNAAALQTAGDDFALTKKEVDEISKATKTPFTDLVKPATEDAKAVKRAKLKDLKPTDNVRVDALKYAETLVLGADKMDAGVLKKENDKLKEWLKQQGVEVNLSDLKPGDEAGKAKRIAAIIKENPFLGELQVTKKEAETVCKATKTALENIVVLNDAPQYLPHQEVPLDLNSVVDKLIISSDKIDKKTLAKHSEKIKEYLEKTGIEVDLSGVKAGDEEGKLKKLRDIIQQNAAALQTAGDDFALTKKEVDEISKATKTPFTDLVKPATEDAKAVKRAKLKDLKPTDNVRVDALKYAETLVLGADKMDAGVLKKENDKLKEWLKQQGVEVNLSDLKPGDEAGKAKRIAAIIKENPFLGELQVTKKEAETVCKATKTALENIVVLNDAPQYLPHQEVPLDLNSVVDKLIISSDKIDKKTLAKHSEKIKEYLEKTGIEVDLSGVKAGDEEGKLKKLRDIIQQNAAALQTAGDDFALTKKEVDEISKATKTPFTDLVKPATEDAKAVKRAKLKDLKPTDNVRVDALKYAETLVLGADKMDAGVLKKENDKLKEWLKQQGVEVNLSDLKPGDEAGKAKRIAAIIKENPFLGELQVTKKEAETVCKATKTALENIVVLNDAPQYLPHQEVPLDLNSVVDKLIISSDKIDKKTLAKHSEKIKEYLEKTGIEVDLSGVKAGDEEGKLKKLRDIIQQNAAALQTAGDDFALTKKEVDEISKATKTPFTDLVKPATEDAKAVKRAKLKDLKPTDNVRVDALKYAETLVLGADKMDAGVLKKENDKLKEWLKQQGVEVNLSDLKPGDEAGKAKRIAAIIKENPFLGELQVTKKEAETVCKATKTALENIVVLNDAPQYLPHQEVPLDLNSVVDKLIISSDKIDKKTLAKHSEKIKEYLEKTGIEVDLSGVKAGDEEGKLKKLRDIIQQNAAALQTAGDDFALTKKEVDEISKATKTPFTDLVKPATEDAKAVKRAKLKDLKPTDNVRVDALKYAETLVLGADKMDAGVLKKENDKLKEWLKQQGVEVNLSDLKPGDEAGKAKRIAAIIKENPFLGELQVTKKEAETVCKATKTALENIVVLNDAPQYLPHQEVPLDLNSVVDKLIISSDKIDKKTLAKHSEKIKEYLEKTGIEVDLSGVKAGDEEGKLKKLRDIIQQNAAALQTAGDDFALTKKEVDEISKATKTPFTDLVKPATEDAKAVKRAKLKDLKPTDNVRVDALKYAETLVLGADKMDAGVLKKENDKLKEWLKQQGVEVNLSDLKPGDEAGKAKRIAAIIKENPFLGELQVTKKEAETVCKATKTALENIVVLNDAPQYLPHQEVPLDLNSVVDKLIISSDKIDKKTLAKHSEKIKEYLEKTGIEVDLSGVKAGDEEGKLKKLRDIIQQNAAALQTAGDDFALTKKEVDEISKATKTPFTDLVKPATEDAKAVKRAKLKDLKPTDNVRVDALKYAETLVLGADKMDAGVLKKENDKLKEWLKQQGVEVNLSDLKPGDEAGKAKRIAAIIKENPFLGELQVTKKEAETVCKATKTALENIVVLNDAPQYLPHQEVPLDLNSVVDKLIISSDKIDKKTLAKHSEKIKEYLEKTGIEVDLSGVKAGDEEGKLKKLRDIIQQNAAALQTAGDDFALTKKEVDEISKATKTPFTDLVKPATEDAKAVKRAKLKDLKPTDNVRVDALKYAETLVLGADKMDAGVLKKENDKLKEWLKQQGVEVNLSDLKPGDEAGKAKRIAAIIKENPFLGELQVTKKEAETVCKATKTALENIVVLNDAPQYLPHQEVPLDLNSVVDKLIISSDKIDKKTLAKHSEKIKEYLEKTGIEVDLSGVKAGDEEGKLKKLRDIIQQNAAALQTAGDDFALTKKEVDEISKATKTPFTDLVKPATEDAKAVKRAKLKDLKPTDNVRVDALKYAETLVLGADKMDAGVLKKENDKLKEWLKQQGVEVNLSDLKPGDEAGKAKRIAAIIKENPFLGELQVTKKEAETVCKATKTALENIVVLNDAPQYLPHQEVPLDLNSVVDKLIISSDKIDKKTLAKHSEKIKEYLEKTGIEVDLSGVKAGDEEGKLKKLRDLILLHSDQLSTTSTPFTLSKSLVDQLSLLTQTSFAVFHPYSLYGQLNNSFPSSQHHFFSLKPQISLTVNAAFYFKELLQIQHLLPQNIKSHLITSFHAWIQQNFPSLAINLSQIDVDSSFINLCSYLVNHLKTIKDETTMISIIPEMAPFLHLLNIIPLDHLYTHYEHIAPLLSPKTQKKLADITSTFDRAPPPNAGRQLRDAISRLFHNDFGNECIVLADSPSPVNWVRLGVQKTSDIRVAADLLRANNLSSAPIARQIQMLIADKIEGGTLEDELDILVGDSEYEESLDSIEKLIGLAQKLNIDLTCFSNTPLVLYEDGARMFKKHMDSLLELLGKFGIDRFEITSMNKLIELLEYAVSSRVGLPVMNYLFLKLQEHPEHSYNLEVMLMEQSPSASSSLIVHKYLQHLHEKRAGIDRKVQFLLILKERSEVMDELIAEYDIDMHVEDLFEYLSSNHPYKIEQILHEYSNFEDSSLISSFDEED
jgi:ferritin